MNHNTGQGHPERADRVTVVIDHLKKLKSKNLIWKKPAKFDLKYLEFAHDKNYLNNVTESFPKQGLNFLDGDTIVSPGSKDATKDAVGSILTAIDGVMKKDFNNAITYLSDFSSDDLMVSTRALSALGDAYAELGEFDKAIDYYNQAASNNPNSYSTPLNLMKLGNARENHGELDEALSCYEKIKAEYPNSPEGLEIDKYIARVNAKI